VPKILIAGVDEVGRGPLAGPVLAAAVILNPEKPISGLADSKLVPAKERILLNDLIKKNCLAWSIGRAEVSEIDELNIFHASLLAMQRAILNLKIKPEHILLDGPFRPEVPYPTEGIIAGDRLIPSISAASIIAKVARDAEMIEYDKLYPQYGFKDHKGYGTKQHLSALKKHGAIFLHRKSFAPVKESKHET
jgi:ribonuclease HII